MFDLEKEIREWKKGFGRHESFEDGLIADMELHLRDAFAALQAESLNEREAFQKAVGQVGTAEQLAAEYGKNRELALDRRTPWRPGRFMPALVWNYTKTALRKLRRQKGYSLINICGLAVGIACSMFIFLYVSYELSFDRHHKDYRRIYRVGLEIRDGAVSSKYAINAPPVAPRLNENFSGVEKAARLCFLGDERMVKKGDEIFCEEGFVYVDPEIFSILSYDFTEGNPDSALKSPRTVVIPRRLAEKYFPHEQALGKTLNINNQDLLVSGVVAPPPVNSHLTNDVFLPMSALGNPSWMEDWTWPGMLTFVKLAAGADARAVEGKMERFFAAHYRSDPKAHGKRFHHFLQPLAAVYLHSSDLEYNFGLSGNPTTLFIFSAIGLFILLIACINFINLATAQAAQRAKEVGVRKVAGAGRRELIGQFMSEAWLTAMLAMLLALGLMIVGRPLFNTLTTGFELPFAAFWSLRTLLIVLALTSAVAMLAGGYPAFYLSAIKPASVFKGGGRGSTRSRLRKTLVIVQFAVSVTLGIGTIIIFQQLHFMQNKNLGFQKGQKIILQIPRERGRAIDWEMLKNIFSRNQGIRATASANIPGWGAGSHQARLLGEGAGNYRMMFDSFFDADFPEVYGLKLASGRSFNREMPTDTANACLINEAAVAAFGWSTPQDAIGKRIETGLSGKVKSVIGVVKDFHYRGVQHLIEPLIMEIEPPMFGYLTLDLKAGNLPQTLATIKDTWRRQFPERWWQASAQPLRLPGTWSSSRFGPCAVGRARGGS